MNQSLACHSGTSRTVVEWTEAFAQLYHQPDAGRGPEDFWNAVMAHISTMGEAIRRNHLQSLFGAAAHAFCWMCSYVKKCDSLNHDVFALHHCLSEAVALKFPMECGHCTKNVCICDSIEMDTVADKATKYEDLLGKWTKLKNSWPGFTISNWLGTFSDIYKGRIHLQTLESIGFHLLEEAGEEAKAVGQLVQFRGASQKNISGIDENLIERLSSIPSLVEEYTGTMKDLRETKNAPTTKDAKKAINLKSEDPLEVRARLVGAKMDFLIEQADAFSWFCAVLLKLGQVFEQNDYVSPPTLEGSLCDVYSAPEEGALEGNLTCYACGEKSCKCVFFPAGIE